MKHLTIIFFLAISFLGNISFAQESLIELKVLELLGPFPVLNSLEEKLEMNIIYLYQKTRTAKQCEEAQSESKASLQNFFGGVKGPLTSEELKNIKLKLTLPFIRTGANIEFTKVYFNRPRPYLSHTDVLPCIDLEKSKAYPSGHATLARMYARILGMYFPERKMQLLARADQIALNRVIGGVHHPSDIFAGIKLGDALAEEMLDSDDLN